MPDNVNASIGIFDSGFGGLTVMHAIRQVLPQENIVYFGDTARLPYGNKSAETITRYSLENARFLMDQGIKALVVACHTACSLALEILCETFSLPILGVVPSALEEVVESSRGGHVGIIGTRSTIQSGVYQSQIQKSLPTAQIHAIPCPLFVPLIEEGFIEHPLTFSVIEEYLGVLKHIDLECLVLGCTHYPLIAPALQKVLGSSVKLIDPAQGCAKKLRELLDVNGWLNPQEKAPTYEFFVSDDPLKFQSMGNAFLRYPIAKVQCAQPLTPAF